MHEQYFPKKVQEMECSTAESKNYLLSSGYYGDIEVTPGICLRTDVSISFHLGLNPLG